MGKLHLLFKKEEIDTEKMKDKIAVVFDVLLATSTMTVGLQHGAKEVIPVLNGDEALEMAEGREKDTFLLVGEYEGKTIDGFLDPNPLKLSKKVAGKSLILSTTNGTVAVRKASEAKKVYICSLLNGKAVAEQLKKEHQGETIVVVCSGSSDQFCLEDFYGAGYFIDRLLDNSNEEWELSDSSLAALHFYLGNENKGEELLLESRVGEMITKFGYEEEVAYVSQKGILPIVPYLKGKSIVL